MRTLRARVPPSPLPRRREMDVSRRITRDGQAVILGHRRATMHLKHTRAGACRPPPYSEEEPGAPREKTLLTLC